MKKYQVINDILLEMDQEGEHWQIAGDTVRQLEADRRWRVRRAGIVAQHNNHLSSDAAEEIRAMGQRVELLSPPWWPRGYEAIIPAAAKPMWHWGRQHLNRAELCGLLDLLRAKGSETTTAAAEPVDDEVELLIVALDQIVPNPYQPRADFDADQLQALADSIRQNGVLQYPVVERMNGGYQLIDGERRWRAAALAGRDTIPVICRPGLDDEERLLLAIESNEQRANLNPVELARALQSLADAGMSNTAIGQRMGGLSASAISNKRRLLQLPDHVLAMVESGQLTERQAAALLPLYSLPPAVLKQADTSWQSPAKILEHAAAGVTSNQIRDMVQRLITAISGTIEVGLIEMDGSGVQAANCLDCAAHFSYKGNLRCINYDCRETKRYLLEQKLLAPAVAASGIAPLGFDDRGYYSFYGMGNEHIPDLLATMVACPNRRLNYNIPSDNYPNRIAPEGLDNICQIVCIAGYNQCMCAATVRGMAETEPEPAPPPAWEYRINGAGRVRVVAPNGRALDLERPQVAAAVRVLWGDATAALLESPERVLLAEARAAILATANRYNMPGKRMIEWYEDGPDSHTWHILAMNVRELPQGIVSQALRQLVGELPEEQLRAEAAEDVG